MLGFEQDSDHVERAERSAVRMEAHGDGVGARLVWDTDYVRVGVGVAVGANQYSKSKVGGGRVLVLEGLEGDGFSYRGCASEEIISQSAPGNERERWHLVVPSLGRFKA